MNDSPHFTNPPADGQPKPMSVPSFKPPQPPTGQSKPMSTPSFTPPNPPAPPAQDAPKKVFKMETIDVDENQVVPSVITSGSQYEGL